MWSAAEPEYARAAAETAAAGEAAEQAERQPQPISRLVDGWQLPAPPPDAPGARAVADEAGGAANEALSFRWVGDTLRHIGTVVHRAMERIAVDGLERWSAEEVARRRPAFANALLGLGVPPAEAPAAAATVTAALTRALGGERGRWLLAGHTDARTEYSLTGIDSGQLVNARIDRTFVDAAGTRWVVDYKTSAHQGGGLEAFLDNERERYRAQLEGYRRLFLLREARPVRMALYFPLMDAWREIEAGTAAQNAGAPGD
jgi:ATP-dependent exoDNAse (exonuclease V) beta subunit